MNYLFVEDFKILKINAHDWMTVPNNIICEIPNVSNRLSFGNNKSGFDPCEGFINNGPYSPTPINNVKFFFIAHHNDIAVCNKLYDIFRNGYGKTVNNDTNQTEYEFKPLSQYIKQPFHTDKNANIFFENFHTAKQEIAAQFQTKFFDKDYFYIALFINPVNKANTNNPYHDTFFKINELLLEKNITSQTIDRESLDKPDFYSNLPNIATAILAKIGGIPWKLQPAQNQNDLIIGLYAFKANQNDNDFIISLFSFNNDGMVQNFDCYRDSNPNHLIAGIRKAIGNFILKNHSLNRLIIHYCPSTNSKEIKPVTDILSAIQAQKIIY